MQRHTLPLIVHGLLLAGDRVLLLRRQGTGRADGFWAPPGGHVEAGELPRQALRREIREETGLEVDADALVPQQAYFYLDPGGDGINLVFAAQLAVEPALASRPDAPYDAIGFFRTDTLPAPLLGWLARALEALERAETSETPGWYVEGGRRYSVASAPE